MLAEAGTAMKTRREFLAGGVAAAMALAARALPAQAAGVSLREAAAKKGVLAGCEINLSHLEKDPAYAALVRQQAGIVVAEYEFKFGPMRPAKTTFNFAATDKLAQFAETNHMKLRGHNFVWHRQLPEWFGAEVTRKNVREVLVEHIERVGGRYAGRVHSWDVVNEAIEAADGLPGGLRDSPWQRLLPGAPGSDVPEYIELAFRTARRVDPKALLTYNDYGIEGDGAWAAGRRTATLGLLRAMKERRVPIDALGVQSHLAAGESYDRGMAELLAGARQLGLKVMVTEMDVNDRKLGPDIAARDAAVAATYGSYLRTVLADPAVIAVLTWGITDRYTWLNGEDSREDKLPERALPFDADLKPKAAFGEMMRAFEA
jgi:endo-1,4-beta-xylanase